MILQKIKQYLVSTMNTNFIQIYDHSHYHNHEKKNLTHIKIVIVSNDFKNQTLVHRHRMIFSKLLKIKKIYSLTLETYTSDEWQENKYKINNDTKCLKKNSIL
ncbi:BolA family transcriptional regulator [Buchnera aphidicola (Macrosiphoniella sanborni)]|uniref:BolA family transcriptional regulator n=1 Tax=Buchnera aphidicola (Macrosiphoniella sanborni) TaxID=1241865 RepID=A0A4D6Y371_9GAMM|nr:BolA/IbaG family iron-sulfur metabolism protein [Buchnera aphidicola]QCI23982.1 BolA family transcriptional regulator [Buchnera aphidicola (Macrosiphoniella sanborni)]